MNVAVEQNPRSQNKENLTKIKDPAGPSGPTQRPAAQQSALTNCRRPNPLAKIPPRPSRQAVLLRQPKTLHKVHRLDPATERSLCGGEMH